MSPRTHLYAILPFASSLLPSLHPPPAYRNETQELRQTNDQLLVRIKQLWHSYKTMLPDFDLISHSTSSLAAIIPSSSIEHASSAAVAVAAESQVLLSLN